MNQKQNLITNLRALSDEWYLTAKENPKKVEKVTKQYHEALNKLYKVGWNYSLYIANQVVFPPYTKDPWHNKA